MGADFYSIPDTTCPHTHGFIPGSSKNLWEAPNFFFKVTPDTGAYSWVGRMQGKCPTNYILSPIPGKTQI